ncbi:TonB-dependent receptor [Aliarcobacter butzleri]|uniref:TonB-dependent receptor domain-containing protein n=1 Tax=Aliarcobacter butzleri TaxID=28197 RepID=UPI00263CE98A|nr:TonB-dependent receptor [Aliarcobacter butzleri]MDN5043292.1 TonB-dependent receptor [Aliarcobacter butzleri]
MNKNKLSIYLSSLILTNFMLANENPTVLDEVIVTSASGYEQKIKEASASISVITSEDLEKNRFNSLQDIVSEIPGVNIIGGGIGSGISIRGMEKGYTLILIDGKRVRSETGNPRELNNEDLDGNFIPPISAIERIEIIRGPMSSLYGSDAMGGIINIITKKNPKEWSGSVKYGYTKPSDNQMGIAQQVDYYLSGPVYQNILGLQLWGYNKLQDEDEYLGGFQESNKKSLSGKLIFTPNDTNDFFVEYGESSQHYTGNPSKTLAEGRSIADREWKRENFATGYNSYFNIGNFEIKYYKEDYERETYPSNATYTTGSTNEVLDSKFVTNIKSNTVSVGYQWAKDELTNNDLGGGKTGSYGTRTSTEKSYFLEDEIELLDEKLFLTLGARLTDNEYFGNHLSPRTYLVYNLDENWTLKTGVGTGYKSPKITQIDETTASQRGGGTKQFLILGNPDLDPEESINYEVGVYYDNNDNFNGSITLFRNDFTNKIISTNSQMFKNNSGQNISAYCTSGAVGSRNCPAWATWVNLDGAIIQGIELENKWDINEKLNLKANYTFSHSEIESGDITVKTPAGDRSFGDSLKNLDGNSLAAIPKHTVSTTLNYTISKDLSSFLKGNYESNLTKVTFEDNKVEKSDKDLLTFDTGLTYKLNKYLDLNFVVYNIFDETKFERDNETGSMKYSEKGRNFYGSVKASF